MTNPTFQELLTSQDARDRVELFHHNPEKCSHWMTKYGHLYRARENSACAEAVWQGYLQEAAPPPEPRVFKRVEYRNVYTNGRLGEPVLSRYEADKLFKNQTDKGAPGGGQQDGRRCGVKRFDFEYREECWDD